MTDVVAKLQKRTGRAVKAHYRAAAAYDFWDRAATASSIFGSVLVIIAGIYFEFLRGSLERLGFWPGIILSMAGFAIFVLTTSQTIWRWANKAEAHRTSATKYAAVRRRVEAALDHGRSLDFDECRRELDLLGEQSPMPPARIWRWADKEYSDKSQTRQKAT